MVVSFRLFETTPLGNILNRFSSDTNTIDQVLQHHPLSVLTLEVASTILTWNFQIL